MNEKHYTWHFDGFQLNIQSIKNNISHHDLTEAKKS